MDTSAARYCDYADLLADEQNQYERYEGHEKGVENISDTALEARLLRAMGDNAAPSAREMEDLQVEPSAPTQVGPPTYERQRGTTGSPMQHEGHNRQLPDQAVSYTDRLDHIHQHQTYQRAESRAPDRSSMYSPVPPPTPTGFMRRQAPQMLAISGPSYSSNGQMFQCYPPQPNHPCHHEIDLQFREDGLVRLGKQLQEDRTRLENESWKLHLLDGELSIREKALLAKESKFKKAFEGYRKATKYLATTETFFTEIEKRERKEHREMEERMRQAKEYIEREERMKQSEGQQEIDERLGETG